jgi:membrane protease YdiL (CAAX protease family)
MLDPDWALTRPLLWLALAGLLVLLVVRSIRKDRREYQRFKRYRTTAKRQAMYRKWLLGSFLSFGGTSVALLLLAGGYVRPLLQELTAWPVIRDIRGQLAHDGELAVVIGVGVLLAVGLLTLIGISAARKEKDVATIGDIQAMLPRNRQEVRLGALLSINAGIVEELLFRLALPALVFGASGNALVAVLFSVLLFGALHVYQGPWGVIGTTVIGAAMMAVYAISGTIVAPIVLHALFDLRSLVLIPVAVFGAHRIDGRTNPLVQKPPAPAGKALP